MEDLVFFLILVAVWVGSQIIRALQERARSQERRGGRVPRERPERVRPGREETKRAEAVTLEEWIERVRRGHIPEAPMPRRREAPAQRRAPDEPEAILREWQERSGAEERGRRETPTPQPPPTRVEPDPYAQRVQLEAEARRRAEELERQRQEQWAREQAQLEERRRREAARMRRREAARRRMEAEGRRVAVPRPPAPEQLPAETASVALRERPFTKPRADAYALRDRRTDRVHLDLSRRGLRQGILMQEILGQPVGLRRAPTGGGLEF